MYEILFVILPQKFKVRVFVKLQSLTYIILFCQFNKYFGEDVYMMIMFTVENKLFLSEQSNKRFLPPALVNFFDMQKMIS